MLNVKYLENYLSEKIQFFYTNNRRNKIRDLFKVKLYTIRSETKKEGEREKRASKREREREKKHMLTLALTGGVISDPN